MGIALTWCAVREEAAEPLLSHMGLSATGEVHKYAEPPSLGMAKLPTGWRLFLSKEYDCPVLMRDVAAFSARGHAVLLCLVEEHVMASSAEMWSDGSLKWRISHAGEDGPQGLDTEGAPPDCFEQIREDMENQQRDEGGMDAGVDYIFEVPLAVARTLVGFKHDETDIAEGFLILAKDGAKKGIMARLFGR